MTSSEDSPAVVSDTFVLIPQTVTDLDDFVEHPDRYLSSIYEDPEGASALWKERARRNPYGDEGLVSLRHRGRALVDASLWDQVGAVWQSLVDVVDEFDRYGSGERSFPDQPVEIRLERRGSSTVLTIGQTVTVVDDGPFLLGVLGEAERFAGWVEEYVGESQTEMLDQIRDVRRRLDPSGTA